MNHISSIRLAALAIGALSCAQSSAMGAPKADKDRAAIVALEQKFNDAFAAKNVDAIMACYAPGNQLLYSTWCRPVPIRVRRLTGRIGKHCSPPSLAR